MRQPRIGIPLTLDDRGRWRVDRDYHYIDRSYADAISRAGGVPLHLPIQQDPMRLIEILDGLLIPGGDDLLPDEPLAPHVTLDPVASTQLEFDLALIAAARRRGLPILGICYGMQLLARLGGGELYHHLPTDRPDLEEHKLADPDARHDVLIEPDSRLGQALATSRCRVNSLHHQAVRSVGPDHRVVARSPDGVIEAIESIAPPREVPRPRKILSGTRSPGSEEAWEIGVQWHPEKLRDPENEGLFRVFIAACAARMHP
jgi:putative glutamine amidotransferase